MKTTGKQNCGRLLRTAVTGLILLLMALPVAAQSDSTEIPQSPVIINADSVSTSGEQQRPITTAAPDTSTPGTPSITLGPKIPDTSFWQKPNGALFKSILVPGWGQYANGKYQKAAIICGIESFFIYKSVQYFVKTRDRFDTFKRTEERADFDAYDDARSNRNKYYWFVAGTIFFSMWDAYADAHIKPF
ncbi:MAG: hypothetical protein GY869_04245, partial [Planctomycetes bacterium]|nr:hypothetical protein [Planctomycetota bacterium]